MIDTLAGYERLSQTLIVIYLLGLAIFFVRSRLRFSPVVMFLTFFFIYSFSYVFFVNLDLSNRIPGIPRISHAAFVHFGFDQCRMVYEAFFIHLLFITGFILAVAGVRLAGRPDRKPATTMIAYRLPDWLPTMVVTGLSLVWAYLFISVFGSALRSGIGLYAAKAMDDVIRGGYQLKLLKGFYSLWTAAIIGALIHAVLFRRCKRYFLMQLVLAVLAALVMGDRSQLFGLLVAAIAAFEVLRRTSGGGVRKAWLLMLVPLALIFINALVTFSRSQTGTELDRASWLAAFGFNRLFGNLLFSAESWAPFGGLVLMRLHDVPSLEGATFWEIVLSFVPRFLMPSRLASGLSYTHYAYHTGLDEIRRGFGMHFVADAYLNGGPLTVLATGIVLGVVFGAVWRSLMQARVHVWQVVIYVTLAGFVPNLLRSGMGAVRYYTVEFLMVPLLLLWVLPFALGRRPERIDLRGADS